MAALEGYVSDQQAKRHHYVPITYLSRFTDSLGRIFAYPKDTPATTFHVKPREIAFERYYYSQPLPEGGQDNNKLERLFSEMESHWPSLVDDLAAKHDVHSRMEALFQFIGLLRVRVPASRDPMELQLAHFARREMMRMLADGDLPALPDGLTSGDIELSVDPHQSIHAMVSSLRGFAQLLNFITLEVVHNTSTVAFISSDNPVVVFDPDMPEANMLPYTVRPPEGRIELLLPITPRLLLRGRSKPPLVGEHLRHVEMSAGFDVRRVNRYVARFGYRFVFANHSGLTPLVTKYGATSPTIRFDVMPDGEGGEFSFSQMVFGPRPQKPKWRSERE